MFAELTKGRINEQTEWRWKKKIILDKGKLGARFIEDLRW